MSPRSLLWHAFLREVGDAVEFRSCTLGELLLRTGCGQDVSDLVMQSGRSPKGDYTDGVIVGEPQERAG